MIMMMFIHTMMPVYFFSTKCKRIPSPSSNPAMTTSMRYFNLKRIAPMRCNNIFSCIVPGRSDLRNSVLY